MARRRAGPDRGPFSLDGRGDLGGRSHLRAAAPSDDHLRRVLAAATFPAHSLVTTRSDSWAGAGCLHGTQAIRAGRTGAPLAVGPVPGHFTVTPPCQHGSATHASASSIPAASAVA